MVLNNKDMISSTSAWVALCFGVVPFLYFLIISFETIIGTPQSLYTHTCCVTTTWAIFQIKLLLNPSGILLSCSKVWFSKILEIMFLLVAFTLSVWFMSCYLLFLNFR